MFLSPNDTKSRRKYEENQTDKIIVKTNVQIYFVYFQVYWNLLLWDSSRR
jgi:hypothetical protein